MFDNLLINPSFLFILAAILLLAVALFFIFPLLKKRTTLGRALKLELFLITVPHEENIQSKEEKKDDKEIIGIMEQLIASFTKIRDNSWREFICGPPQIALEIANPHNDENISFYLAAPKRFATALEKQIYGFYPRAIVDRVPDDYNIFTPGAQVACSYLVLNKKPYLPLKTYKILEADPLTNITNALSSLKKVEEGAAMQIVLRAAPSKWRAKAMIITRKMKQGLSLNEASQGMLGSFFSDFLKTASKGAAPKDRETQAQPVNQFQYTQQELRQLTPAEEEMLKLMEAKTLKPCFEANIRLLGSAQTQEKAGEILTHLQSSFAQFDTIDMNNFAVKKPLRKKEFIYNFSFRNFSSGFMSVLSSEELASVFHFPLYSTQTPHLQLAQAKSAAAPPNLPVEGLLIGQNVFRGAKTNVFLKQEDRRRHLYTIGQTGVGKSGLLLEMARQDIQNGQGVCVIDPHGELIEELLACIPENRLEDVILFDPADIEKPIGLNLLEYDYPEQKTFVINEMINIFEKLYDLKQTGGPMFEQYMRNAMLLVMEHPESGSTLMEISKVLSDAEFRKFKLDHCSNQVVVDFWVKEAQKAGGEAALANMVPYITSKLTAFVTNDIMRPIISQQKSAFNLRQAMDSQKIVLINLSKGKIGELNANLLGMVLVGKILMSAMSRVDMPEENRKDFYLYIDEFQNVTTESVTSILSEARKYRLNLIIAHQFIQQLEENIRDAVFGNVGSLVVFRIGAQDAEFMEKHFAPTFSRNDFINVDNFKAFVKIMIDGQISRPFSLSTIAPQPKDDSLVKTIKDFSRSQYGRDRAAVEEELKQRIGFLSPTDNSPIPGASPVESDMPPK